MQAPTSFIVVWKVVIIQVNIFLLKLEYARQILYAINDVVTLQIYYHNLFDYNYYYYVK